MPAWTLRAVVLAVLHAAGTVILAQLKLSGAGSPTVLTWITIALLVGVALMWGSIDGWRRLAQPVQTWFVAGLVGGLLGGVLNVIGRSLFVDQTGVSELTAQLTSGAAFTALLIIVPAGIGVLVGSRLEAPTGERPPDEKPEVEPVRRSSEKARARRARHRAALPGRGPAPKAAEPVASADDGAGERDRAVAAGDDSKPSPVARSSATTAKGAGRRGSAGQTRSAGKVAGRNRVAGKPSPKPKPTAAD